MAGASSATGTSASSAAPERRVRAPAWLARLRRVRRRIRSLRNAVRKSPVAAPAHDHGAAGAACARPVLLVYGLLTTRRSTRAMERRLRRDGHCVFSIDLAGIDRIFDEHRIDEQARRVAEAVVELRARHRLGPIAIVAHSKGGLVAAHYVKHLGGSAHVRTLVTLGTPHNGTPLAYLGLLAGPLAPSVREMMPVSRFIRRLRETPMPREVWFASLWSRRDAICPWPAAVVERGLPNVRSVEVDAPHHELLLRRDVYVAVRAELAAGEAWAARVSACG